MLINVSNHPSDKWSNTQMQAAHDAFGEVSDLPFPQVPACADEKEVYKLVDSYLKAIINILASSDNATNAVMVQGEYTFTYMLVERLRDRGIKAVNACSERQVVEAVNADGTTLKHSSFMFVRFRRYGIL